SSSSANCYGVNFSTARLTAGTGGAYTSAINLTGIGGTGTGGGHNGVNVAAITVQLNSTSGDNALNFINCVGGSSSGGNTNIGVNFAGALTLVNGALNFQN